jgi:hypothetical protein
MQLVKIEALLELCVATIDGFCVQFADPDVVTLNPVLPSISSAAQPTPPSDLHYPKKLYEPKHFDSAVLPVFFLLQERLMRVIEMDSSIRSDKLNKFRGLVYGLLVSLATPIERSQFNPFSLLVGLRTLLSSLIIAQWTSAGAMDNLSAGYKRLLEAKIYKSAYIVSSVISSDPKQIFPKESIYERYITLSHLIEEFEEKDPTCADWVGFRSFQRHVLLHRKHDHYHFLSHKVYRYLIQTCRVSEVDGEPEFTGTLAEHSDLSDDDQSDESEESDEDEDEDEDDDEKSPQRYDTADMLLASPPNPNRNKRKSADVDSKAAVDVPEPRRSKRLCVKSCGVVLVKNES